MRMSIHPSSVKNAEGKFGSGWVPRKVKDLGELSWLILLYQWGPIVWRHGARSQDNFESNDILVLDFDSPEYPLAAALRGFAGMNHVIGTTRNHQREKGGAVCDRYRVVVPWSRRITDLAEYRHNLRLAYSIYDHADRSCIDGARPYYPCTEIVSLEVDGEAWEVEPAPPAPPTGGETRGMVAAPGVLSAWARRSLTETIPVGERNAACYRLGAELFRAGVPLPAAILRVLESKTYQKQNLLPGLRQEIETAVGNGFRRAKKDFEDERREKSLGQRKGGPQRQAARDQPRHG